MPKFHVTYDITTEESAANGDFAESGFVLPGNWHVELPAYVYGSDAGKIKDECALSFREAIGLISGVESSGGISFYEIDGRDDYQTGDHETRALHCPRNITPASLRRVAKLLSRV